MTIIYTYENPSLDDTLEHHGVKGMHWGVKRGASAVRDAQSALNKTRKLQRSSHKGVVNERKAHREAVSTRKANDPAFRRAHNALNSRGLQLAKRMLVKYATYKVLNLALNGSTSKTSMRGKSFVASSPRVMNAKRHRDGSFKVTSL